MTHVTSRNDIRFTVGTEYPVSYVALSYGVNAIPQAEVHIAPTDASNTRATEFSLSNIADIYDELTAKADELATASLSIHIGGASVNSAAQASIHLSKWHLVSVGMSNVDTKRAPVIVCTIMHPLCKLCLYGGFTLNFEDTLEFNTDDSGAFSFTQLWDSALKTICEAPRRICNGESSGSENIDPAMRDLANNATISDKIADNVVTAPFSLSDPDKLSALKKVIQKMYISDGTPWESIIGFLPAFGLQFTIASPSDVSLDTADYWGNRGTHRIDIENLSSVLFPPTDRFPIFGVRMETSLPGSTEIQCSTLQDTKQYESKNSTTDIVFVPKSSGLEARGEFKTIGEPGWLYSFKSELNGSTTFTCTTLSDTKSSSSVGENEDLVSITDIKKKILEYSFQSLYRNDYSASFAGVVNDIRYLPGHSYSVGSLFTGYLIAATYEFDAVGSSAIVTGRFTHCRSINHPSSIPEGTRNAIYS